MAMRLILLQRITTLSLVLFLQHTASAANGGRKGNAEKCGYKVSDSDMFMFSLHFTSEEQNAARVDVCFQVRAGCNTGFVEVES